MSHTILVADDDPYIREIAGFALRKAGMQTAFARDGGDDYLTKPFSPREMVARVKAILKRTKPAAPSGAARHSIS
jgi:DNA-binding response OmpR family regulator